MEFSPFNNVVNLCIQGMELQEKDNPGEALRLFQQGWHEATNDFEKYLAAYYIAGNQKNTLNKLNWFETALEHGLKVDDEAIKNAFSSLYLNIAKCYEELNDPNNAKKNHDLAILYKDNLSDKGPFYHGTKADLQIGGLLTAGSHSNYQFELKMNHIYFTAAINGAGLAAELAKGAGTPRVYIVEPTGNFENDPNLTDKKFPGNPTRSYRSAKPLKIVGEATDWIRQKPEELQKFRERLANNKGEIIN